MSAISPLLSVHNLKKYFSDQKGFFGKSNTEFKAVDDIDFEIFPGTTLGLVGESGSGKTTIGKCVLRLMEPTSGEINFDGNDISNLGRSSLQSKRADMQMIYQSPAASLNARMTVGQIISEPLLIHQRIKGLQARSEVLELLARVGLKEEHYFRYPHEFSGGQQQRIGIARALAVRPKLLVLDEPTSALDVSVQAQVLNLLDSLQKEFNLTYLFISHDLGVVRYLCDRVALLYLGKIVEIGDVQTVFENPVHPYTQALLAAIPEPDPDIVEDEVLLLGERSNKELTNGCPFAPRCHANKVDACYTVKPPLLDHGADAKVACHLVSQEQQ
ncbi:MAG: hypothetical protein CL398_04500 [Acidiferrobacteraceae bacterium]|nr:hypothetical protein [Acidiferrobacteraceae bacterium]|tara:strand:- start:74 stop:1060 length:987 start_codon:yes stop_codon:yes gene_type:complete